MKRCVTCDEWIAAARLAYLPDTKTCRRCSDERKVTALDVDLDGADRAEVVKSAQDGGADDD